MNTELKVQLKACIENAEEVQEFLTQWYSVADLFEVSANAGSILLALQKGNKEKLVDVEVDVLSKLIDQHIMMANLLKKFDNGEK